MGESLIAKENPMNGEPEMTYTFRNLMQYFLERQRLVVLAMLDISPTLLTMDGAEIPPIDLVPYIELFEERQAHIQSPSELYRGIWKEDWEYRIHGIGCKLTHMRTREPIEWDSPNSKAFRFDWFWQHLIWRNEYESDDPYVARCSSWLKDVSEQHTHKMLSEKGTIELQTGGLCLLNPKG